MANTVKAHQSVTVEVNDGGTVLGGGTLSSDNPMTNNRTLVQNADGGTDYGSKVVKKSSEASSEDHAGVIEAKGVGTGTFAFYPNAQEGERNFIVRGAGTAEGNNEVNNSAEASIATLGNEYPSTVGIRTVNKIHKIVDTDLYGTDATTKFNVLARPSSAMVPGRTKGTGAGSDSNFVQKDGSTAATDDAASPTRGVPGELTFMFGAANPTTDKKYSARDSHEA
jgi:hypothetical protein